MNEYFFFRIAILFDIDIINKLDKTSPILFSVISSIIEPLRTGLHMELSQKLTATDALMKENVTKLMTSKVSVMKLTILVEKQVKLAYLTYIFLDILQKFADLYTSKVC